MASTLRQVLLSTLSLSIAFATAGSASAAVSIHDRALRADAYIASQQQSDGSIPAFSPIGSTADAVLAFVAAGAGPTAMKRALGYLGDEVAAGNVKGLGLRAKVVIAWTAAGRSARTIRGKNLVRPIRHALASPSNVFDTALGVIALESAGATVPGAAVSFLTSNECPDGGWPFDDYHPATEDHHCVNEADPANDFFGSDTNTTSYVVMAITATLPTARAAAVSATPWDFFAAIRDETNGGWGYTWGFQTTDANSTALVLQAYASNGKTPPAGARRALTGLQYPRCGAFAFTYTAPGVKGEPDIGATIGAVPGLLGTPIPMSGEATAALPNTPTCA